MTTLATLLLALLFITSSTLGQIFPESSQDPLSGSTFSTPAFSPSVTFTPVTTFASAETRVGTTIVGVGPSLSTDTYTYVYSAPLSSVSGTDLGDVYASLAANSSPTAATAALQPNPTGLAIVAGSNAHLSKESSMLLVVLVGIIGGMAVVLV